MRPLAAVILLVEVLAELLAVVAAADQPGLTARVPVIFTPVQRPVAVTFAFVAGVFWSAASSPTKLSSAASLSWRRKLGGIWELSLGNYNGLRIFSSLTAVILGVIVVAELLAVVAAAHEVAFAPGVPVVDASVKRAVAVALALIARIFRSAASPSVVISSGTSLAWCWLKWNIGIKLIIYTVLLTWLG